MYFHNFNLIADIISDILHIKNTENWRYSNQKIKAAIRINTDITPDNKNNKYDPNNTTDNAKKL
jgi:ethanolamine ammonia-lyase large subunit